MKTKLHVMYVALLCIFNSYANSDKYRLVIVDNPSTKITIAWNQISGNTPTVYYDTIDHGTNISLYNFSKTEDRAISYRGMDNRFARLAGLLPNTNYYFVIADDQGLSQRFWFKTAPNDDSPLSFIAGGDSRNNRTPRQNANTLVSKLKPHAVLFGGDMTDDDTNTEWQLWFDDWQLTTAADGRMIPIVPARGNHENSSVIYNLFDTPDENSYYAVTFGNNLIRTYTLNSEISVLGDQLTWLQNDLASSSNLTWKMAQYHKPMRPHTAAKSEGNSQYDAWAQLFYDEHVKLVVDCDSHMAKTTWPIKPSTGFGNDEGFEIDQQNGTVYTGEGCWGAPLRPNNDDKSWTRNSGSFNQFKLIFVDSQKIELRTIIVNNANDVGEVANNDPFTLPSNLDVFTPETGAVVTISNSTDNNCAIVGTTCDDANSTTVNDEEDGFCNCNGLLDIDLVEETAVVLTSSDDAEERTDTGLVDLSSDDLELIYDAADQVVGVRFDNIQIPEGSTLYRAYIQFEAKATDSNLDPTNLIINGELSSASTTFSAVNNDISSRPLTSSAVNWSAINTWNLIGEAELSQRTPYLTTIVNEIITQNDWATGNALTFIFSGEGRRIATSLDGGVAPLLKLFYQLPCLDAGTVCDDGDPSTEIDIEDGNCNCIGISDAATVTLKVNSTTDDAEQAEIGGAMYTNSSDLELVYDAFAGQNNQTVGIRFNNVLVPANVEILNAYIQFTADETSSEDTTVTLKGEKTGNSATFTDINFDITNRLKTDALVQWNAIAEWGTVGESSAAQRTPNLRRIVQEIVDQSDWNVFNAMSFFINGEGKRTAESFDGSEQSAPQLVITYTSNNTCIDLGTPCDDGDANTLNDEEDGFCNCVGLPASDLVEDDNLIETSNDDAEEFIPTGEMDLTSSDLELIYDGGAQLVGLRFNNVTLPEEAILYRAYIQFQTDEDDAEEDPTNLIIHGELSAISASFSDENNNISSRITTAGSVSWDDIALWDTVGTSGLNQRTPYVTSIVNEVTSQEGWTSGSAITFIISGSGKRVAEAQDGSAAPILKLFYGYSSPCPAFGAGCDDGNPDTFFDVEDGDCNCSGITETGTLTYAINRSSNDAEEDVATGSISLGSTDLELTFESGTINQLVGLRFTDIQLPANATITNAYIQFTVDDDNTDETNLNIPAEATGNSEEFADIAFNISGRTTLANAVQWSNIPEWSIVGNADVDQRTPNLAPLMQEVLAQPDWQLLSPISFVISGTGEREAEAYDGTAAPQLVIEYLLNNLSTGTIEDEQLKIYPNPAKEFLYVSSKNNIENIVLYNMLGQRVASIKPNSNRVDFDVSQFETGIYFIHIKQTENEIKIYKFIVN
jgi:hypothetical protein